MNSAAKGKGNEPPRSKGAQETSAKPSKDHVMLERIREAQRECGDGVKILPVVRYERKLWFFDGRLKQLRNVRNPHDSIDLNDFEVEYFRMKVVGLCITSADIRGEEESMVWDILCHECAAKAERLLDEREAPRLFGIDMEEYAFCPECAADLKDAFDKLEEAENGGETPEF
jgi:hypothetical protein